MKVSLIAGGVEELIYLFFNLQPAVVLGNKISVSDIDELKIFKVYEHHEIRPQIELVKTEVIKYETLPAWWKSNCPTLTAFTYVFRTVMTNSPNSCPSESLFTIFNATYNDDQKSAYTGPTTLNYRSM